jgi:hypothetical protein
MLTREINALNEEVGREQVHVQEKRKERNVVVANRNALHYICQYSLRRMRLAKRDTHFIRHQQAEQDARKEANRVHNTIGLLKEQALLQQEKMRTMAKQLG